MPAQTDTWWLLRTGEDMWRTGRIALHDTFTHTVNGRYWPNHEWLSQVVFYASYAAGGLPLLTAVCGAAVVSASALVYRMTPGAALDRALLVAGGAAFSTASWSLRPQVFTLCLFAITLWILVNRRHVWFLPPLFLVWANLHGGVATGGLLIASSLGASLIVDRHVDRRLLVVSVLCFLATALTPLGPSLWMEVPASLQRLKVYDVIEWRSPSIVTPADIPFLASLVAAGAVVVAHRHRLRERDTLFLTLAAASTAILALRSVRNAALFFLCAVPMAGTLTRLRDTRGVRLQADVTVPAEAKAGSPAHMAALAAMVLAGVAFVTYAWSRPLSRLAWSPVSTALYDALQTCPGPLYNRYDEGGYLVWFVRNRPVFIDSRQDPFPESLVLEQLHVEATGDYGPTFERYHIACALAVEGSPLGGRLRAAGWEAHEAGSGWTVYTRRRSSS